MIKFWSYQTEYKNNRKKILKSIDSTIKKGSIFFGRQLRVFEKNFIKQNEGNYGAAVGSGTDALIIALKLFGVQKGDEIITVSNTAIPTISAIINVGGKPKFVDIGSDYLIDANKIEKLINKKTKVIIPVHLYGQSCDMDKINKIAKKYNLKVIEDAAQSFGGSIGNQKVGSFGDVAATSFYPAKPLGCYGDGGAIFTNDSQLADKCRAIRIHGTSSDKYNSEFIGLNGRLDTIQAAVLLEKLTIFDDELKLRNQVSKTYKKYFNNSQYIPKNYHSAHALFSVTVGSYKKREQLVRKLNKNSIPNVVYYKYPIHLMKGFEYLGYNEGDFPVSEHLSQTIVSLPMHPYLSSIDIEEIVQGLNSKEI